MTLAAQQIIERLKKSQQVTDVKHSNEVIYYTKDGNNYRIEHFINFQKNRVELHLYGPKGILHISYTDETPATDDMCDFILI